jgi:hypothetical protein
MDFFKPYKHVPVADAADMAHEDRESDPVNLLGRAWDDPLAPQRAIAMLLADLDRLDETERVRAQYVEDAEDLWRRLASRGVREGALATVELRFATTDERVASRLLEECGEQDWVPDSLVFTPRQQQVSVVTRPFRLGPDVLPRLASDMFDLVQDMGCDFCGIYRVRPAQ